jgi:predicted amidophosphoribosyltransferase
MTSCTHCGQDVTGKKFCPACGAPVQGAEMAPAMTTCPRCAGAVKASAAFCMHCGSSLGAQAMAAVSAPATMVSQPATRQCPACHAEVPAASAFCTNCGQSTRSAPAVTGQLYCQSCGSQNNPGARFCNNCGQGLASTPTAAFPAQTGPYQQPAPYSNQPYGQPPSQYQPPYAQPQYAAGYPPQPQPYQGGYQQPMVLRCPVCMAMAPLGTPACPSCHTSLAAVAPTPGAVPAQSMQGQQQGGGLGGFLQGSGGNMAMGALGGAAAVIGGEMLLHGIERDMHRRDYDDYRERDRGEGLLGGLGELGNDLGLF